MSDRTDWAAEELARLERTGLRRRLSHRNDRAGGALAGRVNLSSNDYLDLAGDPRVAAAAAAAAHRWGAGAGASRLITGGTGLHAELEAELAAWKGAEDAVVFSSGYLANTGTIGALVGAGDVIFSDALNHASIIDGCRLSGAAVRVYPHNDVGVLEDLLRTVPGRRRLIVTDGIFSMDGDAADLPGLTALAEQYGAMVMVDDAHGCGVLGPDGRGTPAAQGCADRVDVALGTLSKAFGSVGGYITASAALCELIRNRARGFVFDTALAPPSAGAALEAVRLARAEPRRRDTAVRLAKELAAGLGVDEPAACVVPLVIGDAEAAVAASLALRDEGFEVVGIRPPSVPAGTARLRFTTTAAHSSEEVERAAAAVRVVLAQA